MTWFLGINCGLGDKPGSGNTPLSKLFAALTQSGRAVGQCAMDLAEGRENRDRDQWKY